ncbi:hypothetical protein QJS04_geneDACA017290 [Acorus gramineus]|uniref:OTU domain-containing protein n=1 Tax=Acorus gramineus TaxID=55184 RepID=A0AAV9A2V1_ACOGR|nr:hypothetical protein QJS04_geneDACA017290 [Acorus gramineus]
MIGKYKREGCAIPVAAINPFWRKLGMTPFIEDFTDEVDIGPEIEMLLERFNHGSIAQQKEMKICLKKLSDPTSTILLEPTVKVNTKGRKKSGRKRAIALAEESTKRCPSGFEYVLQSVEESVEVGSAIPPQASHSQGAKRSKQSKMSVQRGRVSRSRSVSVEKYIAEFPPFLTPFISNIYDVPGDGHCGFRVVASFLGMSNNGWRDVRTDLLAEIEQHPDEYNLVFYGLAHVQEVKRILNCQSSTVGKEHWMSMPDMGFVIASCYKIVVIHISKHQCLTFFPLRDPPPPVSAHRILSIGYVNGCHFVGLEFTTDSPLPPAARTWDRFRLDMASSWVTPYIERIDRFRALAGTDVAVADVIDLE